MKRHCKAVHEPNGFDLQEEILREHSVRMRKRVAAWVGTNKKRFECLLELFLNGGRLLEQRAGWPLAFIVEESPKLVEPHLPRILENAKRPRLHGAVLRNTFRLLQHAPISPELEGIVFEACIDALGGHSEIAVKASAITVLRRLVDRVSELRAEVVTLLNEQVALDSPALRVRARKEFGIGLRSE